MGSESITERIRARALELEPSIIEARRYFHRHPELSSHEQGTTRAIAARLDEIGVEYRIPEETGTGIIATIKGRLPMRSRTAFPAIAWRCGATWMRFRSSRRPKRRMHRSTKG